eukprot:tig00020553_g10633.t1
MDTDWARRPRVLLKRRSLLGSPVPARLAPASTTYWNFFQRILVTPSFASASPGPSEAAADHDLPDFTTVDDGDQGPGLPATGHAPLYTSEGELLVSIPISGVWPDADQTALLEELFWTNKHPSFPAISCCNWDGDVTLVSYQTRLTGPQVIQWLKKRRLVAKMGLTADVANALFEAFDADTKPSDAAVEELSSASGLTVGDVISFFSKMRTLSIGSAISPGSIRTARGRKLEDFFAKQQTPTNEEVKYIAKAVGISKFEAINWFRQRRKLPHIAPGKLAEADEATLETFISVAASGAGGKVPTTFKPFKYGNKLAPIESKASDAEGEGEGEEADEVDDENRPWTREEKQQAMRQYMREEDDDDFLGPRSARARRPRAGADSESSAGRRPGSFRVRDDAQPRSFDRSEWRGPAREDGGARRP